MLDSNDTLSEANIFNLQLNRAKLEHLNESLLKETMHTLREYHITFI